MDRSLASCPCSAPIAPGPFSLTRMINTRHSHITRLLSTGAIVVLLFLAFITRLRCYVCFHCIEAHRGVGVLRKREMRWGPEDEQCCVMLTYPITFETKSLFHATL